MSLRGLGNTGHADFATGALDKCIYNKDNSMDIRVAAVQAYRRLSCGADVSFYLFLCPRINRSGEHSFLPIVVVWLSVCLFVCLQKLLTLSITAEW